MIPAKKKEAPFRAPLYIHTNDQKSVSIENPCGVGCFSILFRTGCFDVGVIYSWVE